MAGSVLISTKVEIGGQETDGFYENDILTDGNYWD